MIELHTYSVLKCSGTGEVFKPNDIVRLDIVVDGDVSDHAIIGKIVAMTDEYVTIDSSEKYTSILLRYYLKDIDEMTKVEE